MTYVYLAGLGRGVEVEWSAARSWTTPEMPLQDANPCAGTQRLRTTRTSGINGDAVLANPSGAPDAGIDHWTQGLFGTVMVPLLVQAGHADVGLDSDLFEHCTFCPGTFDVRSCAAIFAASRPAI
jgi:hypothetical protein